MQPFSRVDVKINSSTRGCVHYPPAFKLPGVSFRGFDLATSRLRSMAVADSGDFRSRVFSPVTMTWERAEQAGMWVTVASLPQAGVL